MFQSSVQRKCSLEGSSHDVPFWLRRWWGTSICSLSSSQEFDSKNHRPSELGVACRIICPMLLSLQMRKSEAQGWEVTCPSFPIWVFPGLGLSWQHGTDRLCEHRLCSLRWCCPHHAVLQQRLSVSPPHHLSALTGQLTASTFGGTCLRYVLCSAPGIAPGLSPSGPRGSLLTHIPYVGFLSLPHFLITFPAPLGTTLLMNCLHSLAYLVITL